MLSDLNNEIEDIINAKENSFYFEYDWNQKINNITRHIENKDFEIQLTQNDSIQLKNSLEFNEISILEIILTDIKQTYYKLEMDLAKLQEIIFKENKYVFCSKDILVDKAHHKIIKLKKLISLIEKEDVSPEFRIIFQNVEDYSQEINILNQKKRNNKFKQNGHESKLSFII